MNNLLNKFILRISLLEFSLAILLISIANFPFWILSSGYFLTRPLFNADISLALMATVLSPLLLGPSLVVVWVVDAIQSLSLAYHFRSPAEFATTAKYIQYLGISDFLNLQVIGILIVFALAGLLVNRISHRYGMRIWPIILVNVFLIAIDILNGSGLPSFLSRIPIPLSVNVNVQGSPLFNLLSATTHARDQARLPLSALPVDSRLIPNIAEWGRINPKGAVLVVLVESWGVHHDPELQAWSIKSLMDGSVTKRFDVQSFTMPFSGSTTAGELRTLCGLAGHYSRLHATEAAGCLPNRLAKLGFDSIGLHGFSGRMFERYSWWSIMGLSQSVFAEDFPSYAPRCGGAFKGICDDYLLQYSFDQLKPSRLVYALTLNTHLPLKTIALPPELIQLCRARQVSESVCQMSGQIGRLFNQLALLTKEKSGQMLILITGDHSPPFLNDKDRLAFSASTIPVIIMKTQ